MEKDMTVGKPASVIISFTIPILIGNIFQQFYNMADAIIVGRCVGNRARQQSDPQEPSCSLYMDW